MEELRMLLGDELYPPNSYADAIPPQDLRT